MRSLFYIPPPPGVELSKFRNTGDEIERYACEVVAPRAAESLPAMLRRWVRIDWQRSKIVDFASPLRSQPGVPVDHGHAYRRETFLRRTEADEFRIHDLGEAALYLCGAARSLNAARDAHIWKTWTTHHAESTNFGYGPVAASVEAALMRLAPAWVQLAKRLPPEKHGAETQLAHTAINSLLDVCALAEFAVKPLDAERRRWESGPGAADWPLLQALCVTQYLAAMAMRGPESNSPRSPSSELWWPAVQSSGKRAMADANNAIDELFESWRVAQWVTSSREREARNKWARQSRRRTYKGDS